MLSPSPSQSALLLRPPLTPSSLWHPAPSKHRSTPYPPAVTYKKLARNIILRQSTMAPTEVELRSLAENEEGLLEVRVVLTVKNKMKEKLLLLDRIQNGWEHFMNGIGKGITLQLVSEQIDPDTNVGKRSSVAAVKGWLPKPSDHPNIVDYAANLTVPCDFGQPGAVVITNLHDKEFFLMEIVVHGLSDGPTFFPAHSWIHSHKDNPTTRVLFSNKAYLPSQTPDGLKDLRQSDLTCLRGNGKGERKKHDRIYDYAPYNDLGNPDKTHELARPVLGGLELPYPRRCRTGRPLAKSDPSSESRVEKQHPMYVPRDEAFEELKENGFTTEKMKAVLHTLVPTLAAALSRRDSQFECFSDIDRLYKDGVTINTTEEEISFMERLAIPSVLKSFMTMGNRLFKYEVPSIISRDRFSWLRDNEFARQALAGVNPIDIERLTEFPIRSKLDPTVYGPQESAITKEILERELNGMSLEEAMEKKKLFIIDYHDILLPYVRYVNSLKGRKTYASRTIFLNTQNGTLKPIAIELSLPPSPSNLSRKKVYTHGHDATTNWIWKLAKAHVCTNDAGVHQLVNHWLRTHACMEPYIIAAHRQLSSMHPIFKLLHPHMRYTMEINALARQSLVTAGGIIESLFSLGKYSLEMSSAAYNSMWRFDMEALPADLIRRGMAVEDPSVPGRVKLVINDYPYAADGLLIWSAIEEWVRGYVNHFYPCSSSVLSDKEIQAWWDEIKNEGHADKKNEPWWPNLNTKEDLIKIVTTMIWTASGQHAAINFGQYPFGGYMPNRPTLMKKLIPQEGEPEYDKFLLNPQHTFLSSMPSQLQAAQIMTVQDSLSSHSTDEEYLGQMVSSISHKNWISDRHVMDLFEKFSARLEEIEETINERNKDLSLKNRTGAGIPPYELLLPSSGPGVTGRGIPNSISI